MTDSASESSASTTRVVSGSPRYNAPALPLQGGDYDVRDRLDILNLLGAYGHLFDGGYREDWLATIFAPDARFSLTPRAVSLPPAPTVMEGRDGIRRWFAETPRVYRQLAEAQGLDPDKALVFHGIQNVVVVEQDARAARVVANQFIGVRHEGLSPPFQYVANVRIEGRLEKQPDGCWRVAVWDIS